MEQEGVRARERQTKIPSSLWLKVTADSSGLKELLAYRLIYSNSNIGYIQIARYALAKCSANFLVILSIYHEYYIFPGNF